MKTLPLTEKWEFALTENEFTKQNDLAPVEGSTRQEIVAAIMENQDRDIRNDAEGAYSDHSVTSLMKGLSPLSEAVVDGDHGYDPVKIASGETSGAVTNVGPTVMGLVRRAIPNMIAFDICGVQPLNQPSGQIFSLRSIYGKDPLAADAHEAFHPTRSPDAMYSGKGSHTVFDALDLTAKIESGTVATVDLGDGGVRYVQSVREIAANEFASATAALADNAVVEIAEGMATSIAELQENFNGSTGNPWKEMSFRIDKQTVEAKSRQLKAQYSIELAQDLRAVHGLNADQELSTILATEILLEINREVLLWINATAQVGKTGYSNTAGGKAGVFEMRNPFDVGGARWRGEALKSLIAQVEKEAVEIGRQTGRGQGTFVIASRNVVNAFGQTDAFVGPAAHGVNGGKLNTDTSKATFAGILAGKYKVFIDQYATYDYFTVGFKGATEMDAGIFYSPYVALTPLRGTDPKNFQPVLGFKTRYAIGINPMADSLKSKGFGKINNGMPGADMFGKNAYFRRVTVTGL
ncbi:MAG: hypothetical protein [Caudoviricetes sp.]|nr:MAG: hypothetical protein [Caudoviricetes sp.]